MPDVTIAKVAVSGIPFRLDRPYDYAIPASRPASVSRCRLPAQTAGRRASSWPWLR